MQLPGGTSGFSASGAPITVNLGGAGAAIPWGGDHFNPDALVLNAATANNTLDFQNPLNLTGTPRTINVNASTATISSLVSNSSTTPASLTKGGAGTLVLGNANNSYDGGTTISGGTLSVPTLPDGATSPIGSGNVTFTGGVLRYTGSAAVTSNRTFSASGGNGGFDIPSATTGSGFEVATAVPGNAANTFTKSGAGTLTLSGPADNPNLILNATGGLAVLNKASSAGAVQAVGGISNIAPGAAVRLAGTGGNQIHDGDDTTAAAVPVAGVLD